MSFEEAKELLLLHSFRHEEAAYHPKAANGFLGALRPFGGRLEVETFREVASALKAVIPHLAGAGALDRDVVASLWSICHYARVWALEPEGMLRSNRLISEADQERMADWLDCLSYATATALDGVAGEALGFVDSALSRHPAGTGR